MSLRISDNFLVLCLLLAIVIICAFMPKHKECFALVDNYSCKDHIIQLMMTKGRNFTEATKDLNKLLQVSSSEYLKDMGIDINTVPKEMVKNIPNIDMNELLNTMKKNVIVDYKGDEISANSCLIPVDMLKRIYDESPDKVRIEGNYKNPQMKGCKIGELSLTTNIGSNKSNNIHTLAKLNPNQDKMLFYGCTFDYENDDKFRKDMKEVYQYADFETSKRIKELVKEYKETWDKKDDAIDNNLLSQKTLTKKTTERKVEEAKVPPIDKILQQQTAAMNNAARKRQDSDLAYSTEASNFDRVSTQRVQSINI